MLKFIYWELHLSDKNKYREGLQKLVNDLGYTQLLKEDTHVTQTSSNLTDLIFTNSPHRVTQSGVLNLSLSDHYMIFCNRTCKLPRSKPKVLNVRFKNFNPTVFQDDLRNLPWDIIHLFRSSARVCISPSVVFDLH